jgi:hypothetical protein
MIWTFMHEGMQLLNVNALNYILGNAGGDA